LKATIAVFGALGAVMENHLVVRDHCPDGRIKTKMPCPGPEGNLFHF